MAVRVLIEREIVPGQEVKLLEVLSRSRRKAINAAGYISGETLRALDAPNKFLVISNWNTVQDWKAWEKAPERAEIQREMAPLLLGKEKCSIFTNC